MPPFLGLPRILQYQLWLGALLLLLAAALLAFSRSHPFRLRLRLSWVRARPRGHWLLRHVFLFAACILAAVFLFQLSHREPLHTRVALVLASTVVVGVFLHWAVRQAGASFKARAADFEFWSAEADAARRELRAEVDPAELRHRACELLMQKLECRQVTLLEPSETGSFKCTSHAGAELPPEIELFTTSPLITGLRHGADHRTLRVTDPSSKGPPPAAADRDSHRRRDVAEPRGIETVLAVPLRCGPELDGLFLLSARPRGNAFSTHHWRFAGEVARHLAECLAAQQSMAQVVRQERISAVAEIVDRHTQAIRRQLVPREEPSIPGLEFSVACWPEHRPGGLFHDLFSIDGGTVVIWLAVLAEDQSAIDASVRLVRFQTLIRNLARSANAELGEMVASANRMLLAAHDSWATFGSFCARVDAPGSRLRYVNCGFLPPILLRRTPTGAEHVRLTAGGPPLCAAPAGRWGEGDILLVPEDLLIFPSSSLPAATNPEGETWGETRLIESLHRLEKLPCDELTGLTIQAAERFTGGDQTQPARLMAALRLRNAADLETNPAVSRNLW